MSKIIKQKESNVEIRLSLFHNSNDIEKFKNNFDRMSKRKMKIKYSQINEKYLSRKIFSIKTTQFQWVFNNSVHYLYPYKNMFRDFYDSGGDCQLDIHIFCVGKATGLGISHEFSRALARMRIQVNLKFDTSEYLCIRKAEPEK